MATCYPLLAGDWLQSEWPRVSILCQKPLSASTSWLLSVWLSKIIAWKVINMHSCYDGRNIGQWSSFWQYKLFLDIRKCFSDYCGQTGVWWLKWTNLQFSLCYIISTQVSEIMSTLLYIMTIHSGFLLTPRGMTLNDSECPIHLKVGLADGTLQRLMYIMLWLSELTMCDWTWTWALTGNDKNVANEL